MKRYNLPDPVKVFGVIVTNFPQGISEAFDGLMKMLPSGDERSYYGISECTKEGIVYKAAALETFAGEAEKYGCETYFIEKGNYLAITVMDWLNKKDSIKEVFEELGKDPLADSTKPFVEIYKNSEELLCLVKIDGLKDMQRELEMVTKELVEVLSSFNQEQINTVPFKGSWTGAQLAEHLRLSDTGMLQTLYGTVKPTQRPPDQKIEQIKTQFLDFTTKMNSPEFIVPADISYDKETLLSALTVTRAQISEAITTLNLSDTCLGFVFDELTRLELIYFIIYHTQRHTHQLKNIFRKVVNEKALVNDAHI